MIEDQRNVTGFDVDCEAALAASSGLSVSSRAVIFREPPASKFRINNPASDLSGDALLISLLQCLD